MAQTPEQVANAARCFDCIPFGYRDSAIIYLLEQIAGTGMTGPQIAEAAKCFDCIPVGFRQSAIIYLLDQIVTNGGTGGAAGVTCGVVDPVAPPSGSCGVYYRTDNGALFIWDGAAWQFKA